MRESPLRDSRLVGIAVAVYVVLVVAASFYFNISLTPDRIVVLLLLAALGTGRARQFLKDWSIFVIVILAWQVLQGLSGAASPIKPHVTEMINVDRWLFFGQVPTNWLQARLYHPHQLAWYDVGATVFYLLHFALPLSFAFVLWFWKRPIFKEFMRSFLVLALAGFATFVLFPAAPPWIAANWWHYLPHVYRILHPGMAFFGSSQSLSGLYVWIWTHGGWDLFGAVPSEHAAFPFLCFLYARKAWKVLGWVLLPYCCGVWVSVVYLGEHYVTDVIVGVAYAGFAYAAVQYVYGRLRRGKAARGDSTEDLDDEDPRQNRVSERLPA